jgi:hypothetical protein
MTTLTFLCDVSLKTGSLARILSRLNLQDIRISKSGLPQQLPRLVEGVEFG